MKDIARLAINLTSDPTTVRMLTDEQLEQVRKYLRKQLYARRVERWGKR